MTIEFDASRFEPRGWKVQPNQGHRHTQSEPPLEGIFGNLFEEFDRSKQQPEREPIRARVVFFWLAEAAFTGFAIWLGTGGFVPWAPVGYGLVQLWVIVTFCPRNHGVPRPRPQPKAPVAPPAKREPPPPKREPPPPPPKPPIRPALPPKVIAAMKTLGLPRKCTWSQAVHAYRALVAQYHPDKVAHLGPELQKVAADKTLAFNLAIQTIGKHLGKK